MEFIGLKVLDKDADDRLGNIVIKVKKKVW